MSLFDLIHMGTRGLSASQTALDLVGQNVTNADTDGYTRKRLNLQAGVRQDSGLGQMGFGVDVVNIKRMRDDLLDRQMQEVSSQRGRREELDKSLQAIQNILTEPADSGLNTFMEKFWASWQDLANNPSDRTARQAVADSGMALAGRFNDLGGQFNVLLNQKNDEIVDAVGEINKLLQGISEDNDAIANSELGSQHLRANDTRDQREVKFKELSKYLEVTYNEDPQGRYLITSGGNLLVGPAGNYPLKIARSQISLSDGTEMSQASLVVSSTRQPFDPPGGKLASLMEARDQIIPRYQSALDELAVVITKSVNEQHRQGYNLSGLTGTDFFEPAATGATSIGISTFVRSDVSNIAAGAGGTSRSLGAPLNLAVPAAGTAIDLANTVNPDYRNLSSDSVVVRTVGPPPLTLTEGSGEDYTVDYRTGQIRFNHPATLPPGTAITVDFRYTVQNYNGQGDGKNALKIAQLAQARLADPDKLGVPQATLGDSYSTMVGELGAEKKKAADTLETSVNLQTYLEKRIDETSGVSMDEELADMVRFQNCYQASAKYINTVSQMMDSLMSIQ
ncbi:MAG TPA: flagellar hook-associated protein FlgK [Fibrobacteria bacterium]|nr:flagellar hook-associated protein FlgK [Fibrobacteria bacterium]HOX52304.1 flagellar hook-associated protein FlgK [Fibrobacteria bacterium]